MPIVKPKPNRSPTDSTGTERTESDGESSDLNATGRPERPFNAPPSPSVGPTITLPPMTRLLSVVVLVLGIIVVGTLFFRVMAGFFVPLFLAALLVVLFRPVHMWWLGTTRYRRRLAAAATTTMIALVVLLPIIGIVSVAATQATGVVSSISDGKFASSLRDTRRQLGLDLPHPAQVRRLRSLADRLDSIDGGPGAELAAAIDEAKLLILFLESDIDEPDLIDDSIIDPPPPDTFTLVDRDDVSPAADEAIEQLDAFGIAVERSIQNAEDFADGRGVDQPIRRIIDKERFDARSVTAASGVRNYISHSLGGVFRSRLRLLINPGADTIKGLVGRGRAMLEPGLLSLTSTTGEWVITFIVQLVVLIIAVYFFLIDGPRMIRGLMRLSPLEDAYEQRLLEEFDRTSRAVVLASFASAFVQGVLAALAFWAFGFENVLLLFLATTTLALIPFLGAASVWAPCAIYLVLGEQRLVAGIILAIYGAAIVSSVDNVIKMYVLQGRSTLHPLFALLSVIGGVGVFGPIGIIVGPMVVVFMQTLLDILHHELSRSGPSQRRIKPKRKRKKVATKKPSGVEPEGLTI